jgi:hypothetical protein
MVVSHAAILSRIRPPRRELPGVGSHNWVDLCSTGGNRENGAFLSVPSVLAGRIRQLSGARLQLRLRVAPRDSVPDFPLLIPEEEPGSGWKPNDNQFGTWISELKRLFFDRGEAGNEQVTRKQG